MLWAGFRKQSTIKVFHIEPPLRAIGLNVTDLSKKIRATDTAQQIQDTGSLYDDSRAVVKKV